MFKVTTVYNLNPSCFELSCVELGLGFDKILETKFKCTKLAISMKKDESLKKKKIGAIRLNPA